MGGGYVGILVTELRFPEAGSLKDKRQHLRSTKAQLQKRFGASVAETDFHDVWQRAQLVVALAAAEAGALEHLMDGVERFLFGQAYESRIVGRSIVVPGDE
ncbi:MAG TPA: DUF503 domain-containing protein [Gaiellaceae bacterium]